MATTDILRMHLPETITQSGDAVLIDCSCGAAIFGEMPEHTETAVGAVIYVMAPHLAEFISQS
jgi:hypothetical protein